MDTTRDEKNKERETMKRNSFETILGAIVLIVAIGFLTFTAKMGNFTSGEGYTIYADFTGIGGLQVGDDVQISGVNVGKVQSVTLQDDTYLARVGMKIENDVLVPDDTAALISSESLLGGRFMLLEPGASEDLLAEGGRIEYTQAPQNLEQLLGQFIFSLNGADESETE